MDKLIIREAQPQDLDDILSIEREAFGSDDEAELVKNLLNDPSAKPILSLLAFVNDRAAGHILFTKATLEPELDVTAYILAPLGVVPGLQKKGIGSRLVNAGLDTLRNWQTDWVFVLGHQSYYPRFGFLPALDFGFEPPYSIPKEFSAAWMALALTPTCIVRYNGKVVPANSLNQPHYWSE